MRKAKCKAERSRSVIYARASTDRQELSTKQQVQACYEYAEKHGLRVLDVYEDSGFTGTNDNRPRFQEMVNTAKRKAFDNVLVWKFNRFARNREDSIINKIMLKRMGVNVISISETMGEGASANLLENVLESIDQFFSENLASDIRRGLHSAVKEGFFVGQAPLGYRLARVPVGSKTRNRLEVDSESSKVVKLIFDKAIEGKGCTAIARILNAQGVSTHRGGEKWRGTQIAFIIKNELYLGTLVYGDMRYENHHPAIISKEDFQRANERIGEVSLLHPRRAASTYLLSGVALCGKCQRQLAGKSVNGQKYRYYRCTVNCGFKPIKKDELESKVFDQVADHILNEETIRELVRLSNRAIDVAQAAPNKRGELEANLKKIRASVGRLVRIMEDGKFDDVSPLVSRMNQLREEDCEIEKQLCAWAEDEADELEHVDEIQVVAYIAQLRETLKVADDEAAKAILRCVVSKIEVDFPTVAIDFTLPETFAFESIGTTL